MFLHKHLSASIINIFTEMVMDGRASKGDVFTEKLQMERLPRAMFLQKSCRWKRLPRATYLQKWSWMEGLLRAMFLQKSCRWKGFQGQHIYRNGCRWRGFQVRHIYREIADEKASKHDIFTEKGQGGIGCPLTAGLLVKPKNMTRCLKSP